MLGGIAGAGALVTVFGGALVSVAISAAILYSLNTPAVRQAFGRP